jgi:hypothetical protein
MTGFDEREKGFERKYQQDQELAFRVRARRNHLVGLWAAEQMGMQGDTAEAYARQVLAGDLAHAGDHDVLDKIAKDFAAKNVALDAARIRLELERCTTEAGRQLSAS